MIARRLRDKKACGEPIPIENFVIDTIIRVNFCVYLFCREKFCKKTVYSGIELICEFAKIWLIITKTCFDSSFLYCFSSFGYFAKVLSLTRTSSSFA